MSRVRRAFAMASLEQYGSLVLNFAMVAVLSRILSPSEIGQAVIGIGLCMMVFSLREFVTAEFLIQLPTVTRDDIRTSFTAIFGVMACLALLMIAVAPVLAAHYRAPGMVPFLWVMVAASLIEASAAPAIALLRRDMAFGTLARVRTAGLLAMATTTIFLAAAGWGFMSYAWGNLASALTNATLVFLARPDAFEVRPSLASARAMFEFGRFRGGVNFVDRAYDALPALVLGRFMSASAVGIYNRTNAICAIPDRLLLGAVFSMAFPAVAAQVRDKQPVHHQYVMVLGYITALYWPALILLAVLADPVVRLVLGESWLEAVPLVRIMALASLFFFPVILTEPVLLALGRNKLAFVSAAVSRSASAAILCAASPFGLKAMAASQFLAIPFQMCVSLFLVRRHVRFTWTELFAALARSVTVALGAAVGALAIVMACGFRFDLSAGESLLAIMAAVAGWLGAALAIHHPLLDELRHAASMMNGWLRPAKAGVPPIARVSPGAQG